MKNKYDECRAQDSDKIYTKFADIIFDDIWYKFTDTQHTSLEGVAFVTYSSRGSITFYNDLDVKKKIMPWEFIFIPSPR